MKYEMLGDLEAERETGCYTTKSTPHDRGDIQAFRGGTLVLQDGTRHRLLNIITFFFFLLLLLQPNLISTPLISMTFPLNTILSGRGCGEVCSWTCVERATLVARDSPSTHFQNSAFQFLFLYFPTTIFCFLFSLTLGLFIQW